MNDSDLSELADSLLEQFGDEVAAAGNPMFLKIGAGPDGKPSPASIRRRRDVLGWTAPSTCAAMAAVATGRLHRLDDSAELPARLIPGLAGGIRISCVLARSGRVGWRMILSDGSEVCDTPEEGKLLDVLRRCFGLPTPPPASPMGLLHSITWMQLIEKVTGDEDGRLTWHGVLALHPVVIVAPELGAPEAIIRSEAQSQSWDRLRKAVADDRSEGWGLPPDLAAWMDEGMFARWTLGFFPSVDEMLERVRPRLVPAAARKLAHLVHEVSC